MWGREGELETRMEMSYCAELAGSFCGTHCKRAMSSEESREELWCWRFYARIPSQKDIQQFQFLPSLSASRRDLQMYMALIPEAAKNISQSGRSVNLKIAGHIIA